MKTKQEIFNYLKNQSKSSISMKELASGLQLTKARDFKHLVQIIASLERAGKVEIKANGKIGVVSKKVKLTGIFRANAKGFGFISVDPDEPEIYVAKEHTLFALDGDLVEFVVIGLANQAQNRGAEGKITQIIERKLTKIVGIFRALDAQTIAETDLIGTIQSKNRKIPYLAYAEREGLNPEDGSLVTSEITYYPNIEFPQTFQVKITEVLADKETRGIDVLEILESMDIPLQFPQKVLAEAKTIPELASEQEFAGRLDFRDAEIITIDGADAKDLDDAVQVKRLENGNFELGVHIADVSHYVTEHSALDTEAFERGTSVYVTDRVVPMLPERLSNGICSLNPNVPRLTMTCLMEIDQKGKVVRYKLDESVIQTNARMTYDDVNAIFDEDEALTAQYQTLVPMLTLMKSLHHILEAKRETRGALNFETTEAKIIVDSAGVPTDIKVRSRGVAERLIESFMLVANETVAEHFAQRKLPFIYRIHEHPKMEKLTRFFNFASMLGESVKGTISKVDQRDLQAFLLRIKGRESEAILSNMLLRSMQQARYSEINEGHFGLAAEFYTHFTSPIRRYPDLIVHRMIRFYKDKPKLNQEKLLERLGEIATQASQRERRAVDAEREVEKVKKAEFMSEYVGESFVGVISSVTRFGLFVELPNSIEGMIHISNLDEYFNYQENTMALIGEKSGRVLKLGQRIEVELVKSDAETGEIDFKMLAQLDEEFVKTVQKAKKKPSKQPIAKGNPQPFYQKATKKKKGRKKR
ncbi:MAG: ribonuclease R [Streptococcaceae bacterium]|jgi:ribonuclease R|nr:ribonuclease R [Streptococcaceae bacterium]